MRSEALPSVTGRFIYSSQTNLFLSLPVYLSRHFHFPRRGILSFSDNNKTVCLGVRDAKTEPQRKQRAVCGSTVFLVLGNCDVTVSVMREIWFIRSSSNPLVFYLYSIKVHSGVRFPKYLTV